MPYPYDDEEERQKNRAPAPSNFTNFARYFSGNKAVSDREAGNYANRADLSAGTAADALGKAQNEFDTGVKAGTTQAAPVSSTNVGAGAQTTTTNTGTGAATPPAAGSSSGALTGESTRPENGGGLTSQQMLDQANQRYSGPKGFWDVNSAQGAADAAASADSNLTALGSQGGLQGLIGQQNPNGSAGDDALSSLLIGNSGRTAFDALRAKFNPNADLLKASTDDAAATKAAMDASDKNSDDWRAMAATKAKAEGDEKTAADAAAASEKDAATSKADAARTEALNQVPTKAYEQSYDKDTPENRQAYMMQGVDTSDPQAVAQRKAQIDAYTKAMTLTTQNQMDQTFNDFNSVFNPGNWVGDAVGVRDPAHDYLQKNYGGGLSFDKGNQSAVNANTGSSNQDAIPWNKVGMNGFFVYTHMTPDEYALLNSKPQNGPNGQVAWINTRAAQLREYQAEHDSAPQGPGKSQQ